RHLMAHPAVAEFARMEELLEIARVWVGPGAVPYRCTLFEKSGVRNWLVVWHQDTTLPVASRFDSAEWGPWSEKEKILYAHAPAWVLERIIALRVHLDASTAQNGPLKILPSSHREGVLSDEQVFERARRSPPREILVGKGGVMAMRPLLIHASSKALAPKQRRVLHIEYAASMDLAAGIRLAKA
ncbi:MAG TPA: phytanoyl-CoA dioxygenase family protein, partial [Planctomycetota bacterium]|nr:phytanoyl-CoA dioxygenase family protein [Planctomycetota bacterium]